MSGTILIVDDEPNMLRLAEYALKAEGYEILTAESGRKALTLIQTQKPDLVVLDIMLPDISGIEVCQQLRAKPETADLTIILLSARGRVSDKIEGLKAGADEYVTKPVDWDEMAARVSALLERRRHLDETRQVKRGRVIGFLGAKGGVGTTTIVVNLATTLAQQSKSVLALELTPGFGVMSALVSRVPSENLRHLLELYPKEIDEHAVSMRLVNLPYGPRMLFGPQKANEFKEIAPEQATTIIQTMSKMGDFILVDFSPLPLAATQAAVRECDLVALVIEPQPACLVAGKVMLELLRSLEMSGQSVGALVVNRTPSSMGMSIADIKTHLNCEIIGVVPPAVDACVNAQRLGAPLVLSQPQSVVTLALAEIANRLAMDKITFVNL